MDKITISDKSVKALIWIFIVANVLMVAGLLIWGNTPQIYQEYVVGSTTYTGTNKSLELKLFWMILVAGIALIALIAAYSIRRKDISQSDIQLNKCDNKILVMGIMIVGFYIYRSNVPTILIFALVAGSCLKVLCREEYEEAFFLFMILFLAMVAVSNLFCERTVNIVGWLVLLVLFCILLYSVVKKESICRRLLLMGQCCFPAFLLVYMKTNYEYNGENIVIERSISQKAFWGMAIFLLLAGSIYHASKYWNQKGAKLREIISIFACISIAGLCNFQGIAYQLVDGHHQGELVLAFQQMTQYQQVPYVDYYPVSGLFSFLLGGIMELFGSGLTSSDAIVAIYTFLVSCVVVILGSRYVSKEYLFLMVSVIPMANGYVRTNLLLPYLLILLLPKLIEKKGVWLLVWVALSFVGGFYYPLYGMASVLGILPLGLLQLTEYIKQKEYKMDMKKPWFVILCLLELIIIVIALPSLAGAVRHTLVYASGSKLSNSIAVFGTSVPDFFMNWLSECEWLRRGMWYTIRYSVPALFVWIFVLLAIKAMQKNRWREVVKDSKIFNMSVYAGIVLTVSCTLTLMRIDEDSSLARTAWVLIPMVSVVAAILLTTYIKHSVGSMLLLAINFLVVILTAGNCVTSMDSKLMKNIEVEEDKVYISREDSIKYENLGEGFLPEEVYRNLERYSYVTSRLLEYDPDLSFWGLDLNYIYALNLKTCGQPSVSAIASYGDAQMEIESLVREKPVIFTETLYAVSSYYLYKWLMQTDLYCYSEEYDVYLPVELAEKAGLSCASKKEGYKPVTNIGRVPGSLGKSFENLSGNFDQAKVKVDIAQGELIFSEEGSSSCWIGGWLDHKIHGTDADFLYLKISRENANVCNLDHIEDDMLKRLSCKEINPDCTVVISWEAEAENTAGNSISCKMENGELFIPLGVNVNWLLNEHYAFQIVIYGLDEGEYAAVDTCMLLKSQNIAEHEE